MSCASQATGFAFASPHDAIDLLVSRLVVVEQEKVALQDAAGRVLSQPIHADRDSPPSDVSAMDGFAIRDKQATSGATLEVTGEIKIGQPAPEMPSRGCLKIGTGACVPADCGGIIPRERVDEASDKIILHQELDFKTGQHIRRQGENTARGDQIAPAGIVITPPLASALAAFGHASVEVFRPIRVAILTTGDELLPITSEPEPWQIRDSNGTTLNNALAPIPWIEVISKNHAQDNQDAVATALQSTAKQADLIITTGGVSMGDHDYIKPAILQASGEVVYHKLPIRPGKPSLSGLIPMGNSTDRLAAVVALPGNPVAVAVGVPLFVAPVAHKIGGFKQAKSLRPTVLLRHAPKKTLPVWRYMPVRWYEHGRVELITTMGSGDPASAASATGYVEIPPNATGIGPWVFYDATL